MKKNEAGSKPKVGLKKIPRKTRNRFALALTAVLIGSVAAGAFSYLYPPQEEVERSIYSFNHEAALDYSVYMVPNELFPERVLGPDRAYITNLVESIAVEFSYSFSGEDAAELSGYYSGTAKLAAYTTGKEHLVWETEYPLLPGQSFSSSNREYRVSERVIIPLADYLSFIESVRDETGFAPAELNLYFNCNLSMSVQTPEGEISEELSPTMVVPLKGSTFSVAGNLVAASDGAITRLEAVASPPAENFRLALVIAASVSALLLLLLLTLTRPLADKKDRREQKAQALLRKHGDRIVTTAEGLTAIPKGTLIVDSFDELLKVADEVGRPIIYPRPGDESKMEHLFLIYTQEKVYAYSMGKPAGSAADLLSAAPSRLPYPREWGE